MPRKKHPITKKALRPIGLNSLGAYAPEPGDGDRNNLPRLGRPLDVDREPKVQLNVTVPLSLDTILRKRAQADGSSLTYVVRNLLRDGLNDHK